MEGYVRVTVYLIDGRVIEGDFNVSGEPRLKDAINDGTEFVVLKNTEDHLHHKLNYLLINKRHIITMEDHENS
jgi:hypothetical protein